MTNSHRCITPFKRATWLAGLAVILCVGTAIGEDVHYDLTARMTGQSVLSDGTAIATWGFRLGSGGGGVPQVPGPIITANEGDQIFLHFTNMSMMPHTIHPHGLDVDQANDGVPQTSFEIPMMGTYTYQFTAPHAGSYAYHCHVETIIHLQMGMYGAINILPPDGSNHAWDGGPAFDFERTWITAEIDLDWNDLQEDADFTVYEPGYFLVNGKDGANIGFDPYTTFDIEGNETVLLRLGNMGYQPVRYDFGGLWAEAVASDGRPLPAAQPADGLMVTPGERYDVLVRGGTAGEFTINLEYLDLYDGSVLGQAQVPVTVAGSPTEVTDPFATAPFSISLPSPSPASTQVAFRYRAPLGDPVEVWVFDVRGRTIRHEWIAGGSTGSFAWDGKDSQGGSVASGVYHFRFRHGRDIVSRKVTLLR